MRNTLTFVSFTSEVLALMVGGTMKAVLQASDRQLNKMNWDEAESKCIAERSHLTSIHNYEENMFVATLANLLLTDSVWIGYRHGSDTSFVPQSLKTASILGGQDSLMTMVTATLKNALPWQSFGMIMDSLPLLEGLGMMINVKKHAPMEQFVRKLPSIP
uniref:C-type lectin domain-containing protein n=1 Tax=Ditylenchus dipsaci TaxID=166011 RepID=A0A915DLX9_9BILA